MVADAVSGDTATAQVWAIRNLEGFDSDFECHAARAAHGAHSVWDYGQSVAGYDHGVYGDHVAFASAEDTAAVSAP